MPAYQYVTTVEFSSGTATETIGSATSPLLTVREGDLLVIQGYGVRAAGAPTFTFSGGLNTYYSPRAALSTANNSRYKIAYVVPAAAGTYAVTCTFGNNVAFPAILVSQYRAVASYLDGEEQTQAAPGTGTDSVTSTATPTLATQPVLVWGASTNDDGTTSPAAGTGFTGRGSFSTFGGVGDPGGIIRVEDRRITVTTGQAATFTATAGAALHASLVAVFAEQKDAAPDGIGGLVVGDDASFIGEAFVGAGISAGAPSHPTSGALAADAATMAGTAAHFTLHATSGALAASAATLAGAAVHRTLHTTTGALTASAATIAGTAAHHHATTGALVASLATLAGTAAHLTLHTTSGSLVSGSATLAGSAAHHHATTGALAASAATISGAAERTAGGVTHATSGALAADAATISGTAAHHHATTGALAAAAATLAGSAAHLTLHATSGALAAQAATITGAAAHQHATTGALVASSATLAGSAAHLTLHTTSGALAASAAVISGAAEHSADGAHDTAGAMAASDATMSGEAVRVPTQVRRSGDRTRLWRTYQGQHLRSRGALVAGPATMGGQAQRSAQTAASDPAPVVHAAAGAMAAADATMSGGSSRYIVRNGLARQTEPVLLQRSQESTRRRARIRELEAELAALRQLTTKATP